MKGLAGSDVPFMTRRVKAPVPAPAPSPAERPAPARRDPLDLGEPTVPAPPPGRAPSTGLDLAPAAGRAAAERPVPGLAVSGRAVSGLPAGAHGQRPAPATPESRLYPAPAFGRLHQLAEGNAVVRLNPRQSGIGSLFVTGARGTAWEGEDRTTGAQSVHREQIGTPIPTPGNRPLVGFVNRDAVVVLRHVRRLRRALFIGAGGTMTVQTFDGSAIAVQGTLGPGQRTVLTATRIGALLELRAESVPEDWDDGEIWREFAFTMTVGLGGLRR
ncbi:hypothetical protein [Sinomonas sp. RB5]